MYQKIFQKKVWSKEDIEKLLNMKKKKVSLKQIAIEFNVSINAISKTLNRYLVKQNTFKKITQNSFFDVIQWFNKLYPNFKIYQRNGQFLLGDQYHSLVSIIIILNKFRLIYQQKLINEFENYF